MSQEKQVIYLEADAEITEAIDKLRDSNGDQVQIVVPGRSHLLQSVVNLKLLKKAAKDHKKELVLVTSDKTAVNLAAKVGLAVAATVGAVASIPEAPELEAEPDIIEKISQEPSSEPSSKPATGEKPIMSKRSIGETEKKSDSKATKKPKVPNFNLFQKKMAWVAGGIGVIVLILILAYFVQSVKVTVSAKSQKKPIELDFTLNPNAASSKPSESIIAARQITLSKDFKGSFNATGKKDVGTKATGTAAIKNCEDSDARAVAAGTKLTASGKTFIATAAATIPGGDFSNGGQTCDSTAVNVSVASETPGDSFNLSGATFTMAGQSSRISGSGTTTGGTSKTVTVVAQSDIDGAKAKMLEGADNSAKSELFDKASKGNIVFEPTFKAEETSFSSSTPAGSESYGGSVSAKITYSVLTGTEADISDLLKEQLKGDIPNNYEIYDNGASSLKYSQVKAGENGQYMVSASTTAYVGEKIDEVGLAKKLTGKSKKEVSNAAKAFNSSITSATASGWPLVPNMPLLAGNIKIEIKVDT